MHTVVGRYSVLKLSAKGIEELFIIFSVICGAGFL